MVSEPRVLHQFSFHGVPMRLVESQGSAIDLETKHCDEGIEFWQRRSTADFSWALLEEVLRLSEDSSLLREILEDADRGLEHWQELAWISRLTDDQAARIRQALHREGEGES